ncbi:MAG: MMPL family transporter [Gemmatimonadota bacterium]|nr:MAG: MMPL family transporter [Gemmatimonadota bacterium]
MITPPGRLIVKFRALILFAWAIAAVVSWPRAARVQEGLRVEGQRLRPSDSQLATDLIVQAFPQPVGDFFAITVSGPVPIDSLRTRRVIESISEAAGQLPYITRVVSYLTVRDSTLVSDDRLVTFVLATVEPRDGFSPTNIVAEFRDAIHSTVAQVPGSDDYEVLVTGRPALDYDVRTVSKDDARSGERKALPFSAMVLVLAFGALVAAVLPLVVGVLAIVCSLAVIELISGIYPTSVFVLTIVSMVGLAVGIDYSLLIVTRFREELNRGRGRQDAAIRSVVTAGRAVVTSGLTVAVGFASLLVTPITETRSVGMGGLVVVTVAVLLSVTALPAALSYMGRLVDVPRALARKLAWYHAPTSWERWARWLVYHPWRAIAAGGIAVALITWPLAQIKIGLPRSGWFPSNTESSDGVETLQRMGAGGTLQPVRIVVRVPEGHRVVGSRYIRSLMRLSDSVRADPRVAQVRSVVDIQPGMSALGYTMFYGNIEAARSRSPEFFSAYLSSDNRSTLIDVILSDTTSFTSSMDVVRRLRTLHSDIAGLDSAEVLIGGFAAASVDLQDDLLQQFPLVIGLVLVSTVVMLAVAFRSVLVPLKAVLMNCFSVLGAFGVTVLVFQQGVGSGLFGLDGPTEAVYVVVPVLVFAVVFGLSMDYGVFLLARIKEAFDRSGRNDQATIEGLTATASVITSAAAIMVIVFGVFSFSRVLAAQMMGFGLAVAVVLDATLIRMVLAPAIMHIAGRWNWWPGVKKIPVPVGGDARTSGEARLEP